MPKKGQTPVHNQLSEILYKRTGFQNKRIKKRFLGARIVIIIFLLIQFATRSVLLLQLKRKKRCLYLEIKPVYRCELSLLFKGLQRIISELNKRNIFAINVCHQRFLRYFFFFWILAWTLRGRFFGYCTDAPWPPVGKIHSYRQD